MNWEQIQGNWKQLTGKAKENWGRLTDDDLDVVAEEEAEKQLAAWGVHH